MTNNVNICAHHGTSHEGELGIIRDKEFKSSNKDNEWLGKGIYFFYNNNSKENGIKWAKYVKKYKFYSIIEVELNINKKNVLDLDDEEWQDFFHDFRKEQLNMYKKQGIDIQDEADNAIKLDCKLIDDLVKKVEFDLVKQRRYIEFRERGRGKLIGSHIPNCSILCVKNSDIINSNSIKCIERGRL